MKTSWTFRVQVEATMNIDDSADAPLARGGQVLFFPGGRPSGRAPPAARRVNRPGPVLWKGFRRRGSVALWLAALSAVLGGWQSQTVWAQAAGEPTDAQLVAIVRQYGAGLRRPVDLTTGRAVRVQRTAREWVVTLIDPRRLDAPRRHYVGGARSAYHIDRATLRVVAVVVTP